MIPYGAVYRSIDDEVVMVIKPKLEIYISEPDWYHVIVLEGTPGVDYSIEQTVPVRRITSESRWDRID